MDFPKCFQIIKLNWNVRNDTNHKTFKLSHDFIILEIKEVRGELIIYAGVFLYEGGMALDALVRPTDVEFVSVMTGELCDGSFPENHVYCGSVVMSGGSLVYHIWMRLLQ